MSSRKDTLDRAEVSSKQLIQKIIDRRIEELTRLVRNGPPSKARLRCKSRLSHLPEALAEFVIRRLVLNCPSATRKDFISLLAAAWPSSRGTGANQMFDPDLVRAAHAALLREHPDWGSRAATQTLAENLMVTPRTIQARLRIRARKNR